ncbi:MAG: calcium-binding protein [Pseudomonadota bacterium]
MSVVALLALLGVAGTLAVFGGDDDSLSDDGGATDEDPSSGIDVIATAGTVEVSGGDDTITIAQEGDASLTVDAGAGDDTISFTDFSDSVTVHAGDGADVIVGSNASRADIDLGSGDDLLTMSENDVYVNGGAGNDTIMVEGAWGSVLSGGAGDDHITAGSVSGDIVRIDGGEGNDTLSNEARDFANLNNVKFTGGAGDDVIIAGGVPQGGTGYVVTADGGDGDDTIIMRTDEFLLYDVSGYGPAVVTGGDGADVFILDPSETVPDTNTLTTAKLDQLADDGVLQDGILTLSLGTITDFDPAEDSIHIDGDADADSVLATARLEMMAAGQTELILTYETGSTPSYQVTLTIQGGPVTFDDITFLGTQMPELIAPPAA